MFGRRRGDCRADLNVTQPLVLTLGGSGTQQIGTAVTTFRADERA